MYRKNCMKQFASNYSTQLRFETKGGLQLSINISRARITPCVGYMLTQAATNLLDSTSKMHFLERNSR